MLIAIYIIQKSLKGQEHKTLQTIKHGMPHAVYGNNPNDVE